MNIRLHIQELILDGLSLSHVEELQLRAEVENELSRLLAEQGLNRDLHAGASVPEVTAAELRPAPGARPVEIGKLIARSIYAGIGQTE